MKKTDIYLKDDINCNYHTSLSYKDIVNSIDFFEVNKRPKKNKWKFISFGSFGLSFACIIALFIIVLNNNSKINDIPSSSISSIYTIDIDNHQSLTIYQVIDDTNKTLYYYQTDASSPVYVVIGSEVTKLKSSSELCLLFDSTIASQVKQITIRTTNKEVEYSL